MAKRMVSSIQHRSVQEFLTIAILLSVYGISAKSAAGELPAPDAVTIADIPMIEEEVIRQRRALTSGRVVLSVVNTDHVKGTSSSMRYTITFDRDNFRNDLFWTKSGTLGKEVYTESDGRIDVPSSNDRNVLVNPHYPNARQTNSVPDPRILGIAPTVLETLNQHGYDTGGILNPTRRDMQLSITEEGGERLLRLEYVYDSAGGKPIRCKRLLSPEHGYLPVMISTTDFLETSSSRTYTLRCELRRYPESALSYPSKVVFIREKMDGGLYREQTVVVEDADFGAVDATEFTLAGLGLEKGRSIDFGGQLGTWDGNSFRAGVGWTGVAEFESDDTRPGVEPEAARPTTSRKLLALNAILLAAIALGLFEYRRRRSGRSK